MTERFLGWLNVAVAGLVLTPNGSVFYGLAYSNRYLWGALLFLSGMMQVMVAPTPFALARIGLCLLDMAVWGAVCFTFAISWTFGPLLYIGGVCTAFAAYCAGVLWKTR